VSLPAALPTENLAASAADAVHPRRATWPSIIRARRNLVSRKRSLAAKPPPPTATPKLKPAAVEASAPAPKPAATDAAAANQGDNAAGPYRIQFGAFTIEDNAHRIQWAVEATGLPVEVAHLPSPKGRLLYYVRSQPFPIAAAALNAAASARDKAKGFVNAEPIEYVLVGDAGSPQHADAAQH